MKKIILLAGLLFAGVVNAQITVTHDGTPFVDNETFTYTTGGVHLPILITNASQTETSYVKIRVDQVLNTTLGNNTGDNLQFCVLDVCYTEVTAGVSYPPNDYVELLPGQSTSQADHFYTSDPGNGQGPVTYSFTVLQTDSNGNPTGEIVSFTYKYDPTAGVEDFAALQNMGINVKNTVVKDVMNINAALNATMQVYNINGQLIKTAAIVNGNQTIDLSGLTSAVYIARFTTKEGKTSQVRIVKN